MNRLFNCALISAALTAAAPILPVPAPFGPALAHADGPAPHEAQRQAEIAYMEFTIDHHGMGVMMAMIGIDKATDPRLVAVSHQMAMDQAAELRRLQGWLHDWYGITYEPHMMPGDAETLALLNALPEGRPFDTTYSSIFINHHATIIERSANDRPRFYHPALRQFASHVIQEQSREIFHVFIPVLIRYYTHH